MLSVGFQLHFLAQMRLFTAVGLKDNVIGGFSHVPSRRACRKSETLSFGEWDLAGNPFISIA